MDRLHIRRGTRADSERILDLLKVSLGEGLIPRELAYWNWKHLENPFGESPILLAEAEGELVGLRVFMRWEWSAGEVTAKAVRAVDTATHPSWQGRGIFSKLTRALVEEMREEGVHFIFNTPNEKSRPGYLKMGWKLVGRTDLWARPNRPWRIGRSLLVRKPGPDTAPTAAPRERSTFRSVEEMCDDAGVRRFLGSLLHRPRDTRLTTPRTPEYLRWRYSAIPGFTYHALFETVDEEGAIVVFRQKAGRLGNELRVCELILGHRAESRSMARALLNRLHKHEEVDYLSAIAPARTPERSVLVWNGYVPTARIGPILTVNPLNPLPRGIDPAMSGVWRFSIGDLELF